MAVCSGTGSKTERGHTKASARVSLTELKLDTAFVSDLVRLMLMSIQPYSAFKVRPMITYPSVSRQMHPN